MTSVKGGRQSRTLNKSIIQKLVMNIRCSEYDIKMKHMSIAGLTNMTDN